MLYQYLLLRARMESEEGQDVIEYVLIAGFIALAAVAALGLLRTDLAAMWTQLQTAVNGAKTGMGS